MEMVDLKTIAANLERHDDGIWYARQRSSFYYPEEGNEFCYGLEEESFWFNHRNAFILEAIKRFPPHGVFFDIGGGNGFVSKAICDAGYDTVLVEPGIEGVHNAQQRGIEYLVCATLEDAGFQARCMPAVGMFDVLEHIQEDISFLEEIKRHLVTGGRLYLTVPAYKFLWSKEDDFAQHYRRYTCSMLGQRLTTAGFRVEYSTYIFATLPLPIYLFRTLPSKLGWRKTGDLQRAGNELNPDSSIANRLLDLVLQLELRVLQRYKSLPFGGSCLVVARNN